MLEAGKQEIVVLSALSPMEIYLSSTAAFAAFNDIGCVILDKTGKNSDYVHLTKVGQLVLVYKENCWNRAVVEEVLANGNILVELLDFPEVLEVEKSQLRQAPETTLEFPVLAAKCALDCFYGKEEEATKQVEKLRSLQVDFRSRRERFSVARTVSPGSRFRPLRTSLWSPCPPPSPAVPQF